MSPGRGQAIQMIGSLLAAVLIVIVVIVVVSARIGPDGLTGRDGRGDNSGRH